MFNPFLTPLFKEMRLFSLTKLRLSRGTAKFQDVHRLRLSDGYSLGVEAVPEGGSRTVKLGGLLASSRQNQRALSKRK